MRILKALRYIPNNTEISQDIPPQHNRTPHTQHTTTQHHQRTQQPHTATHTTNTTTIANKANKVRHDSNSYARPSGTTSKLALLMTSLSSRLGQAYSGAGTSDRLAPVDGWRPWLDALVIKQVDHKSSSLMYGKLFYILAKRGQVTYLGSRYHELY